MSLSRLQLPSLSRRAPVLALLVALAGVLLTTVNVYQLREMQSQLMSLLPDNNAAGGGSTSAAQGQIVRQKYVVYGKNIDSGYLKHVYAVLERAGYSRSSYNATDDWTLMWAHDYPFRKLSHVIRKMKKWQRVNKFPGSGYVTNKVNLATSKIDPRIPRAFKIPDEVDEFKSYASSNPNKLFVQKNKNHRGIKIEPIERLDLEDAGSFVQEFVDDPLLIDGYKFDIGVYTMITSIDPLRIYVFEGDVLLRFCPEKYHPFDAANRDKYVVHDDYRPTWKVPTLAKIYSDMGFSFRETLNTHIRSMGRDPDGDVWTPIYDVIRNVYRAKEKKFADALKNYPHQRGFFEMVRFDFVLDADLRLYLMEANMSPNLSTKHFAMNRLLYEQVLYTLFRLNGVLRGGVVSSGLAPRTIDEAEMQVAEKDLHVFPSECVSQRCSSASACDDRACQLCRHCLSSEDKESFKMAFLEHTNRHQARRIFPKPVSYQDSKRWREKRYGGNETETNVRMDQWFMGKCLAERNWCD